MPLTNTEIQKVKATDKPFRMFDGGGLYLEVSPAGGKLWRLKYRFDGKEKRLALGIYPDVTLKNARERRDDARTLLADGVDPSKNREAQKAARAERGANSFEVVAREWFDKFKPNWVQGHSDKVIRRLERDVFPWIGGLPISEVRPPDLLACLRRIESRGVLETAHRALQSCGQIFRYAVDFSWRLMSTSASSSPAFGGSLRRNRSSMTSSSAALNWARSLRISPSSRASLMSSMN